MWSLDLARIQAQLSPGETLPKTAIETGTARGNGALALSRYFANVVTVELSPVLYEAAKVRLGDTGIWCLQGNSVDRLPEVFRSLPTSEPIFLFLDAHWSGDDSVDWQNARWKGYGIDTAHLGEPGTNPSAEEQCPLLDELQTVVQHWPGPAWILIDDLKNIPTVGPGRKNHEFPGEDWSHLSREKILAIVKDRLVLKHELRDPEQWLLKLSARE